MDKQIIDRVIKHLVDAYQPTTIFIYGSVAWGTPDDQSDLDVLVVVERSDEKPYKRILKGQRCLRGIKIPKDILVYTSSEFNAMADNRASLCYKIKREGIKAYDAKAA